MAGVFVTFSWCFRAVVLPFFVVFLCPFCGVFEEFSSCFRAFLWCFRDVFVVFS